MDLRLNQECKESVVASLSNPKQLQNITMFKEFMRYCAQAVDDIQTVINGQIEYGQNIKEPDGIFFV